MGGKLFGLGLAGVLAAGGSAVGQFASDRPGGPPPAAAAPGVQPAGGVETRRAAPAQAPPAAYLSHPMGVRPEHGPYMICVKSYSGPQAQKFAEQLCEHVRTTHKAAAYLFEYGGEERAAETARQAAARERQRVANEPFLQQQRVEREKAKREGREFVDEPVKVTVPKVTVPEQWAVLVGGFPSEEVARRALDVVRKWPPPAERLMDQQFVAGGTESGGIFINPFAAATVFPSPAVKKTAGPPPVDPALAKLNADEPLSLLKTRKRYTLLVKAFTVKTVTKAKDEEPGVFDRLLGRGDEAAKMLQATAHDARQLAEALRRPEMRSEAQKAADKFCAQYGKASFRVPPLDAYVLHTRTGSLVTVGDYDSEDDPDLVAAGRILQYMEFEVKATPDAPVGKRQRMFDNVIPLPIPRPQ
jgi:hypothetical protein